MGAVHGVAPTVNIIKYPLCDFMAAILHSERSSVQRGVALFLAVFFFIATINQHHLTAEAPAVAHTHTHTLSASYIVLLLPPLLLPMLLPLVQFSSKQVTVG